LTVKLYREAKKMSNEQNETNENNQNGLIDMTNRILQVLLSKPVFKQNFKTLLQNIDPDSAPDMVRTLIWQDMEFMFSLIAALPRIANVFIKTADEILIQVKDKIPDGLLEGYIKDLVREIDTESMERLKENFSKLWEELSPVITAAYQTVSVKETVKHEKEAVNV